MDNFLQKPYIASEYAQNDCIKLKYFDYINNDDNDEDSFVLSPSCQCEKKRTNENKIVDSTLAFFATTQHTLSTFCSTVGDDDDDLSGCWDDDDVSLGSFNDGFYRFDCQPHGLHEVASSAEQVPMMAQPMAITFNNSNIEGNIQGHSNEQIYQGNNLTSFHTSQESLFQGSSDGSFQLGQHTKLLGAHEDYSIKQGLNDSMSSLSEAFEKLDYCMARTAESRKLVRQLTEKMAISSQTATFPCGLANTTTPTSCAATTVSTSTKTMYPILRSNSLGSLTCNSSVSSKNRRKGPKSYHKSRRQGNKNSLSNKTGVAIRTLLNASFS